MDGSGPPEPLTPLFRPEAIASRESRLGSPVRAAGVTTVTLTVFLVLIFVAVLVFLVTVRFSRKETVAGSVEPSGGAMTLTAPRAGIVREVMVKDGQAVAKGDTIARISVDTTIVGGARLGEILSHSAEEQERSLRELHAAQRAVVQTQRQEAIARRESLTLRLEEGKQLQLMQRERIALSEKTVAGMRSLADRGLLSQISLRQQEDNLLSARQTLINMQQGDKQIREQLNLAELEIKRSEANSAEQAARSVSELAGAEEKRATYAAQTEIIITAPRNGKVGAIQIKEGAAIALGQTIAVVLPEGGELEAVLWVPSRAAGFARKGDPVRIMFDAFPYQRFGMGRAAISDISSAPIGPQDIPVDLQIKEPLYRIKAKLARQTVDAFGQSWPLAPGMKVQADIILERRSLLDWMMEPVLAVRQRDASFK